MRYDADEPLMSFEITAHLDYLSKSERKKLFKQIDNMLDHEDTDGYDITLSKGNKVATITGVTDLNTCEDLLHVLRHDWELDCEYDWERAYYSEEDMPVGMGWRDTSWD